MAKQFHQPSRPTDTGRSSTNRSGSDIHSSNGGSNRNKAAGTARRPKKAFGLLQLVVLVLLLILPVMALGQQVAPHFHRWIVCWAAFLSVASFVCMKSDKLKAANEEWRTPEATLHLLELLGGWPGSFIAQRVYRHKTSKKSYQATFWLIVLLYQIVSFDAVQNWLWGKQLIHWLERL